MLEWSGASIDAIIVSVKERYGVVAPVARVAQVRQRCRELLRGLEMRPPVSAEELTRRIGEARGRPIVLREWPLPVPGPFGMWLAGDEQDLVFYQQQTSAAHQRHIIFHELGHIVCGHDADVEGVVAELPETMPPLPEGLRWRGLRRTCYTQAWEQEAEAVASTIADWAAAIERTHPRPMAASGPALFESLNLRRGWL
ncbi:hypothetical protein TPB0596_10170 [Tsukamurella pulmonis]|uniref:ImmA/IrrE family metallo-endopeptidase n=1 Tax=Tsukamurella pulmonis TaxID=47312 RepID=UPI001EDF4499|nr:hypothetical protein [Tsukamurella pulmonis]BDD81254.1 hypothetical protein TPB0596_10170 [Tsukamurella pulmonis]